MTTLFYGNGGVGLSKENWDDLRVPANLAKAIPGQEATWVAYRGGLVLNFSKTSNQGIAFNVQLPHRYKLGSNIEFHVHMILPTSGGGGGAENVKFDFTYSWSDMNSNFPVETTVTATRDVQNDIANKHIFFDIASSIDGSGIAGVSSMLICSLTRDISVANNYDDVVYLAEVDFHFQNDSIGSDQEASKSF